MKIMLINPPQVFSKVQVAAGVTLPLGLLYLSAVSKKSGYDVKVIDALAEGFNQINKTKIEKKEVKYRGLSIEQIVSKIKPEVKIVAISNLFSLAYPLVLKLIKVAKGMFPNLVIVVGGAHVSALPNEVLKNKEIDYVIIGEGEKTFLTLLKKIKNGLKNLEDVDGLAYRRSNGQVIVNPKKEYLMDLDVLPFPDIEAVDLEKYYQAHEAHGPTQGRWMPIISSRGCPFECTFCTSGLWDKKFRARSAKNVVDEIEKCVKDYNIKEFLFEDENFTLDKKRVWQICDEIKKRDLKISWQTPNGIRASVTDFATLDKMKEAGCHHVVFAPESGSERVLNEIIKKHQDLDKVTELVCYAKKIKLKVCCYFVIGLPGEKKEDINLTIKYANKLAIIGVDEVAFSLFIPLPGSFLYNKLLGEGKINNDWSNFVSIGDLTKAKSWSDYITDSELNRLRCKAYLTFYFYRFIFHPLEAIKSVNNVIRGKETSKTERTLITFLKRFKLDFS